MITKANVSPLTQTEVRQVELLREKIKKSMKQKPTKAELRRIKLLQKKIKNSITVRELISQLSGYPADAKVSFSGLDFFRLKHQGENCVQVQFGQVVYLNRGGRIQIIQ